MKLESHPEYSKYSLSIVLHLIRTNEEYKKLWIKTFPKTEAPANNFSKNENCGCRPSLVSQYKLKRFEADLMTVNFLNSHPDNSLKINDFIKNQASRDLAGHVFAIPATEGHYKDFLASIEQQNSEYRYFDTLKMNDKIIITFF